MFEGVLKPFYPSEKLGTFKVYLREAFTTGLHLAEEFFTHESASRPALSRDQARRAAYAQHIARRTRCAPFCACYIIPEQSNFGIGSAELWSKQKGSRTGGSLLPFIAP